MDGRARALAARMDDVTLVAGVLGAQARARAARALASTGGVADLARCSRSELAELLGDRRAARRLQAAFALGERRFLVERRPPTVLASSADVAAWAAGRRLVGLEHEELWLLALDGRGGLRGARCIGRGGLHGLGVRASDVLRVALRLAASAFVLVHNHPSGDATASSEDIAFTAKVTEAADVVGLPLVDHVVVARGGFMSVPAPARSA